MDWFAYSLIGMVSFALMILLYKKLLLLGLNPTTLNLYIFGLVFIGLLFVTLKSKTPVSVSKNIIILLLVTSVFSLIGNTSQLKAFDKAPNPGYAVAVLSTQVILVTVLSKILFGSDFSFWKIVGIVVTMLGIAIIALG